MFRLNTIMQSVDGRAKFVNYPSRRMVEKAKGDRQSWEYLKNLIRLIEMDTGMAIPEYARG